MRTKACAHLDIEFWANKGADGYVVKPFKMDDLLTTIKEHLTKQEEAKK